MADDVGDWALHGIDAREYAMELTCNAAEEVIDEPEMCFDPVRVFGEAYTGDEKGASSAPCMIALTYQVYLLNQFICHYRL